MELNVFPRICLLFVLCVIAGRQVHAGRAFPVTSEQFTEKTFRRANPNIKIDPTNFLVDLAGQYASCRQVRQRNGIKVEKTTPEGTTIGGLVDYYKGAATDANTVDGYLKKLIPQWLNDNAFLAQIKSATRFGCSVQPGCSGFIAVACLFSPGGGISPPTVTPPPILPEDKPNPRARAFTPEQYDLSERVLGMGWDRGHLLENLSGYDIECSMVSWQRGGRSFGIAAGKAAKFGIRIRGEFGSAINEGDTEKGIIKIIKSWNKKSGKKEVGCSVIPDCIPPGNNQRMYIVVECLFSEGKIVY